MVVFGSLGSSHRVRQWRTVFRQVFKDRAISWVFKPSFKARTILARSAVCCDVLLLRISFSSCSCSWLVIGTGGGLMPGMGSSRVVMVRVYLIKSRIYASLH